MIVAAIAPSFEAFRARARVLLAEHAAPSDVLWEDGSGQKSLFGGPLAPLAAPAPPAPPGAHANVPAAFVRAGTLAALHASGERWSLLYRVVFRLTHGEAHLLELTTDPDVVALNRLVSDVKHDEHRMHAFLRFRRVPTPPAEPESFVAWYVPDHHILELASQHFARRYQGMRWVILTPEASAVWDGTSLRFGAGATRDDAPAGDELEALFSAYYGAIFNPARLNLDVFGRHVPARFHGEMPEITRVTDLARDAPLRSVAMQKKKVSPSLAFIPEGASLSELAEASRGCTACPLYEKGTQTVFGEGPARSPIVLVGEQPGDQEDRQGHPFVGPAGRLLDEVLAEVGVPRDQLYVTNAVKHFKWEPRGKRRLHAKPNAMEINACNGWLEAELAVVRPEVIVCLGATAAQAFMGRTFKITERRGEKLDGAPWARTMIATYHPSALLRMIDDAAREEARRHFAADLKKAAALVDLVGHAHDGKKRRASAG
ncbi:MAG: Uracil-DNA glycosylase, putative family 6 [Labilithrix sp.]|nr:Uracil-DNA glycosylase, putative family 6 [Labilithrix sp.]